MPPGFILRILSDSDVEEIHEASLELLEEVGVEVREETALKVLRDAGATVDFETQRVRFPAEMVEKLIGQAPREFTWYGRNPEHKITMGDGDVHFGTLFPLMTIIDLDGRRRPAVYQDCEDGARLVDALEYADEGAAVFLPQDIAPDLNLFYALMAAFKNSAKPIRGRIYGREQARLSIQMAEIVAGGSDALRKRPLIIGNINTVSPLVHHREQTEGLMEYARHCLPVFISPEVQAGATGPVTLAGSLVVHNAEVLSGICLVQAVNPGNPVAYGAVSSILDMRTGSFCYGAIEHGLLGVATAQMAHFYGIPSRGDAGYGDSKVLDMQAAIESGLNLLLSALGQHDYIFGAVGGGMESVLTASVEKIVIDNEVAGMARRVLQGIEMAPETVALDLIKEVGPGKHYLGKRHTLEYLRREQFLPELADRQSYYSWREGGAKDIRDRAREKARHILATHDPEPLDPKVLAELEGLLKSAGQALGCS